MLTIDIYKNNMNLTFCLPVLASFVAEYYKLHESQDPNLFNSII